MSKRENFCLAMSNEFKEEIQTALNEFNKRNHMNLNLTAFIRYLIKDGIESRKAQ